MNGQEHQKTQLDSSQATGKLLNSNTIELTGPKTTIDKLYAIINTVKSSSTRSAYESLGAYEPLVLSLTRTDSTLTFTGTIGSFEDVFDKNNIKISKTQAAQSKPS